MIFAEKLSITYLKNIYQQGLSTPYEVCIEIEKRAQQYTHKNIWITPPSMQRMKPYINKLKSLSQDDCPLWGIPFAIKDNIDLQGIETTAGCPAYGYIPPKSAFVVQKLIEAGAIPVGKTNLDQFATGLVGTRSAYGAVHNALNDDLLSGGSSSGSAVAVTLGLCSFALGTDTAGSGRVPAALNGIFGYKPPCGAWSTQGVVPACASLDCVTALTINLEDAKLVNLCARGVDEGCEWSKSYPIPLNKLPQKILLAQNCIEFYGPYKQEYEKKWKRTIERIKTMKIPIDYIDYTLFKDVAALLYEGPWIAERWKDLGSFVMQNPQSLFPITEKILQKGNTPDKTAAKLFDSLHALQKYKTAVKKIMKDAVLIMPTVGGTYSRKEEAEHPIAINSQLGLYTNHCNLLNLCAIELPEDETDTTIPFGLTLFAQGENEDLIQATAETFLAQKSILFAVCGVHKHGFAQEYQLLEKEAIFIKSTVTDACYKLYTLPTVPAKPALIRSKEGRKIAVDLFQIPLNKLGSFMQQVSSPLAIGDIVLENHQKVKGFVGESYGIETAEDITHKGIFLPF